MQHTAATDVYAELCASVLIGAANRTVLIPVTCTLDVTSYFGYRGLHMCTVHVVACAFLSCCDIGKPMFCSQT